MINELQRLYANQTDEPFYSLEDQSHKIEIAKFSLIDDTSEAFKSLYSVASGLTIESSKTCEVSFNPLDDNDNRYCHDIAPFMLLDRMMGASPKFTQVKMEEHESLKKAMCCLHLSEIVPVCRCNDPQHKELFGSPVVWLNPKFCHANDNTTSAEIFNREVIVACTKFEKQLLRFKDEYGLRDEVFSELESLETHLWEILSNVNHAIDDTPNSGELGFGFFLAKRGEKLYCNICVVTLGRTIFEAMTSDDSAVSFRIEANDSLHDFTEAMMILSIMKEGASSSRGFPGGGLHNFFRTTEELSSKLDVSLVSGNGIVVRKKDKDKDPVDIFIPPMKKTPGTIISVRFEVEL